MIVREGKTSTGSPAAGVARTRRLISPGHSVPKNRGTVRASGAFPFLPGINTVPSSARTGPASPSAAAGNASLGSGLFRDSSVPSGTRHAQPAGHPQSGQPSQTSPGTGICDRSSEATSPSVAASGKSRVGSVALSVAASPANLLRRTGSAESTSGRALGSCSATPASSV